MCTLDIIILIPLAWFAFKGFSNGFVVEIAIIIALLLGLYAAIHFSEYTAEFLVRKFSFNGSNVRLVSYVITFVLTMVLVYFIGRFLSRLVKTAGLGIFNRIAGLLFGILKAFLLVGAFLMLFGKIDPKSFLIPQKQKERSLFYKPVVTTMSVIFPVLQKYTDKVKGLIQKDKAQEGSGQKDSAGK